MAAATGHELAVPTVVLSEYLAWYERDLASLSAEMTGAFLKLRRAAPDWWRGEGPVVPNVRTSSMDRGAALRSLFSVLLPPSDAEKIALDREIQRLAPASTSTQKPGTGARDVVIWLTVLNQLSTDSTVYFVSEDKRAFGETSLLPDLVREADRHPGKLVFCPGIGSLLGQLGEGVSLHDSDRELIETDPIVQSAVVEFLNDPGKLMAMTSALWRVADADSSLNVGPPAIRATSTSDIHAYRVDGVTWVSSHIDWIGTIETQMYRHLPAEPKSEVWHFVLSFPSTVLTRLSEDGRVRSAQALSVGRFAVDSAYLI